MVYSNDVIVVAIVIAVTMITLITCTFYTRHRNILLARVETVLKKYDLNLTDSVEVLLYGHPSLDVSENKTIILATLEFIDNTKRFE